MEGPGSVSMETGKLPGKRPGMGVAQVARAAGLNRLRLPCGVRVAAAPSHLDSGQWCGSSCAVRPISGPSAGPCSGARCADLVVEGTSSGEESRARAGEHPSGSEGVAPLRLVPPCPGIRTLTCLPCRAPSYVNPAGSPGLFHVSEHALVPF